MDTIITIIVSVVGGLSAIIGTITSLLTKGKLSRIKNTASLRDRMLIDIMEAERIYGSFKIAGVDTAGFKKSYVMNDLQSYALSNGIQFDSTIWGDELERMIQFSYKVNSNKAVI